MKKSIILQKVHLTFSLILSLACLAGCSRNKDKSIFSQLNGQSIDIPPDGEGNRGINTNEPKIGDYYHPYQGSYSYLRDYISEKFHLAYK